MPELIPPTARLHAAWLEAHAEWGPGQHEDGFGLHSSDEVDSPAGFAAWLTRLASQPDPTERAAGHRCLYRWIVEDDRVLGGIALRYGSDDYVRWAGHIGYGIRPSARRRGLASWALGQLLEEARAVGLDRALLVCAVDNLASAKTIEQCGGVLETVTVSKFGPVRRYWINLLSSANQVMRRRWRSSVTSGDVPDPGFADSDALGLDAARHGLLGRREEQRRLTALLHGAREGRAGVLVLRGEAGIGKSALLSDIAKNADDFRVCRAGGVESEMELAYAGLQQLCGPLIGPDVELTTLHRNVLDQVFGLTEGSPSGAISGRYRRPGPGGDRGQKAADRLADRRCAVDRPGLDASHWIRRPSAARRAGTHSYRYPRRQRRGRACRAAGTPDRRPEHRGRSSGCSTRSSAARPIRSFGIGSSLKHAAIPSRSSSCLVRGPRRNWLRASRNRPVFRSRAGLNLPLRSVCVNCRLTPRPCSRSRQPSRRATRPCCGPPLNASDSIGAPRLPPERAGLLELGQGVYFRHPLVRAAAYRSAPLEKRLEVHRTLAELADPIHDADRRAWHWACSTVGHDEKIAAELERTAGRARARGGLLAAAALLERAALLTPHGERRADRTLAAARAKRDAGAFESALRLLSVVDAEPRSELRTALAEQLRGKIAFDQRRSSEAAELLFSAAQRIEPFAPRAARDMHLEALAAAVWAAGPGDRELVAKAAQAARATASDENPPRTADLVLDAIATRMTEGYAAATPALTAALDAIRDHGLGSDDADDLLWLTGNRLAGLITTEAWDHEAALALAQRQVSRRSRVGRPGTASIRAELPRQQRHRHRRSSWRVGVAGRRAPAVGDHPGKPEPHHADRCAPRRYGSDRSADRGDDRGRGQGRSWPGHLLCPLRGRRSVQRARAARRRAGSRATSDRVGRARLPVIRGGRTGRGGVQGRRPRAAVVHVRLDASPRRGDSHRVGARNVCSDPGARGRRRRCGGLVPGVDRPLRQDPAADRAGALAAALRRMAAAGAPEPRRAGRAARSAPSLP